MEAFREMPVPEAPIAKGVEQSVQRGGTSFFKLANPELMFNHKSRNAWIFVGLGWLGFGGYIFYVDSEEKERLAQTAKRGTTYGPRVG